jgi:cardiolipin synthase
MLRAGNRIELLENGAEYFPALMAAIETAEREIYFESYLFAADHTGYEVAHALSRAVLRGVRVRVMLDGFGAFGFDADIRHEWRVAGVDLLIYRPPRLGLHWPRLRRLHRKLVVIDARVAFVGGINVIDDRNAPGRPDHRYDYAVRVEGPLLADIYPATRRLWRLLSWSQLHRRPARSPRLRMDMTPRGEVRAQFVLRDNLRHRRDIEQAYLSAIRSARHEIVIANAYFLPGMALRRALVAAAQRGVRVVLLLQGRSDHPLVREASRALYRNFLEAGVEIREYHASFMHAKVAVIDDVWATVGSSNIDPFSLWLAREANVVMVDPTFARQLRASLEAALQRGSHVLHRMTWRRIGWFKKMWSWLAYGLLRVLMGLVWRGKWR